VEWVRGRGLRRPVFVIWTATPDWSFINWYERKFAGSNPLVYGGIDIRTYEMARLRSSWGTLAIIEERGELNFWRNQDCKSALEQTQMFKGIFARITNVN
jgi:hypothetical protein